MEAIETRYGGHRFRSRLEARWSIYFDALGIAFHYEPNGFELPSGKYLPDFWLPQFEMWAEVKPTAFSDREEKLVLELVQHSGRGCAMLVGPPDFKSYRCEMPDEVFAGWFCIDSSCLGERRFFASGAEDIYDKSIRAAVEKARAARFEFGEKG